MAARGIVLDIYSSQTVALCSDMGAGIRGSIVGVATIEASWALLWCHLGIIPSCHMVDKRCQNPGYST